jgi:hypothetical protein|tara:strand:+ start:145 stop:441 length:297 start_codon:yes stop_codon:yes gene_type:complete
MKYVYIVDHNNLHVGVKKELMVDFISHLDVGIYEYQTKKLFAKKSDALECWRYTKRLFKKYFKEREKEIKKRNKVLKKFQKKQEERPECYMLIQRTLG